MRKRTAARRIALQALYQWDLRGDAFRAELNEFVQQSARSTEEADFAASLVRGCREHLAELDARISAHAQHWSLQRMAALDRNILRLGAYELMFRSDIPPKVSIDEAISLANQFSTAESGAFVNGILDPLMSEARPDNGEAAADKSAASPPDAPNPEAPQ